MKKEEHTFYGCYKGLCQTSMLNCGNKKMYFLYTVTYIYIFFFILKLDEIEMNSFKINEAMRNKKK